MFLHPIKSSVCEGFPCLVPHLNVCLMADVTTWVVVVVVINKEQKEACETRNTPVSAPEEHQYDFLLPGSGAPESGRHKFN